MKRVLFVVKRLDSGGIENYLLRFIKFSNHMIEPHILCKGGVTGHLDGEYLKNNASILYTKIGFFPTFSWLGLTRHLREYEFDAIVDFNGDFAALVLLAAWKAGLPKRIVFYRNSRYTFVPNAIKLVYARTSGLLVRAFSTKILSNSKEALDYFHPNWGKGEVKYEVIHNGVPSSPYLRKVDKASLRRAFGIPDDAFVVGHVGRHGPGKNHDLILEVATKLCQKYENIYFLLCGKGVTNALAAEISARSLQKRVIMPGVLDNVPDVLQIMDVFFFPSTIEGQPNALIEAMLSNLPIVASDIGPIKECVPPLLKDSLISLNSGPRGFLVKIESLYISRSKCVKSETSSWAKNAFSPEINFVKFLDHLV